MMSDKVSAVIAGLLPPSVISAEEFADIPGEPPFPGEEPLIATAVEGRRREFVTARRCARQALAGLGVPAAPILTGPRREPLWPAGVRGSITHCAGYRAAAVARQTDLAAVGIDAEPNAPLPAGVWDSVTVAEERAELARLETGPVHWDRLLFSAKESVYKAWFPLTGRWLGFDDACLSVDPATGTFRARILIDGTRLDGAVPLTGLTGRFLVARGLVVTAVTVPRSAPAAG
jgi:enterobactin synthetase component D / holo-[acyl-carrier protein] synthase